jgi:hypothetical protein
VPARTMRASLVMFLFIGMFTSIVYLLGFGIMDKLAIRGGLLLAPIVAIGVLIGSCFFARPSRTYTRNSASVCSYFWHRPGSYGWHCDTQFRISNLKVTPKNCRSPDFAFSWDAASLGRKFTYTQMNSRGFKPT